MNERTSWCCCGINNAMFKRWVYWRHLHEIIIKCCTDAQNPFAAICGISRCCMPQPDMPRRSALLHTKSLSESKSELELESHSPAVSRPISGGPIDVTSALCLSRSRCPSPGSGQVNRRRRLLQYKSIAIYATAHTKVAEGRQAELGGKAYVNMAKDMRIGKGKSQDISNLKCDFATKNTHK